MKTFILPVALAVTMILFTGCMNNGKEYKLDKEHNILYKGEGIDESMAKKLAEYLKEQMYFQPGKEATVQITRNTKTKDTINLNFIVDKSKITPDMESKFILFGGMIDQKIFSGTPLNVRLFDKNFEEVKNLGYAKPVSDVAPVQTETTNPQTDTAPSQPDSTQQ